MPAALAVGVVRVTAAAGAAAPGVGVRGDAPVVGVRGDAAVAVAAPGRTPAAATDGDVVVVVEGDVSLLATPGVRTDAMAAVVADGDAVAVGVPGVCATSFDRKTTGQHRATMPKDFLARPLIRASPHSLTRCKVPCTCTSPDTRGHPQNGIIRSH